MYNIKEKYQQIIENAKDAIILTDKHLNILYSNPSVEKLFGYSIEEITGKNLFVTLTPAKYHEAYAKSFKLYLSSPNGVSKTFELSALNKDETECIIEVSVSSFSFKNDLNCIFIIRDVTERKETESTFKEIFQDMFQAFTEKVCDAVVIIDSESKISYWNPAAETMFGYDFIDVIDNKMETLLIPTKYQELFLREFNRIKETDQMVNKILMLPALKKDGTEILIELSISAIFINNVWNAITIIRDITSRKDLGTTFNEQMLLYNTILQTFADYMYVASPDYELVFLNSKNNDRSKENLYEEKQCYQVIYNRNNPCPWCKMTEVLKGEKVSFELFNPVDSTRYNATFKPVIYNNNTYMLSVLQNINDIISVKVI